MKRLLRWLRNLILAAGILTMLLLAAYIFVLPRVAESQIRQAMHNVGIDPAEFVLRSISHDQIQLDGIRLGSPEWASASSVRASYTLATLWNGRVSDIEVDRASWRLEVRNGEVKWGPTGGTNGSSSQPKDVAFDRVRFNDLAVTADIEGKVLEFHGDATLMRSGPGQLALKLDAALPALHATVSGRAQVRIDGDQPEGTLSLVAPAVDVHDAALLRSFIPALRGIDLTGTFAAHLDAKFEQGALKPLLKITAQNIAASRPDWPVKIESASSTVRINSFTPLQTDGTQQATIASATAGDFHLTNGSIEYEIQSSNEIRIASASWNMGEYGNFASSSFTLDPSEMKFTTTLTGEQMDLDRWLHLLTNGRAKAQGKLAGSLRVGFDPAARYPLRLGESVLAAQRPETGWVQVQDADMVSDLLGQIRPPSLTAAQWDQAKAKVREALRDYEYKTFRVELLPEDDDVLCRIQTSGKGRKGPDPVEFGLLTLNIHNFNHVVNESLRLRSLGIRDY